MLRCVKCRCAPEASDWLAAEMSGLLRAGVPHGLGTAAEPAASRDGAAAPMAVPRSSRVSLRDKGRLALVLLVAFFGLLTGLGWLHMSGMRDDAAALEGSGATEARLHEMARTARAAEVDAALAQSSQLYLAGAQRLAVQLDRLRDTGGLGISGEPPWQPALQAAAFAFERFQVDPSPRTVDSLRAVLATLGQVLDAEERAAEQRTAAIARTLQERAHDGAMVMLAIAVVGSAVFGLALMLFMRHLAGDLDLLRQRATQILCGEGVAPGTVAPPPISPAPQPRALAPFVGQPPSTRHDEVGHLAVSLEQLASRLAVQQRDLEIERRKVFNQEKQAALGALAAGVLEEIGNPIAAVDGYARALHEVAADQVRAAEAPDALQAPPSIDAQALQATWRTQAEFAAAIVREVDRLHAITHDMAVLAAPQASEQQLVSLNDLVGIALGLLRFDARLRGVHVEPRLDAALPALRGRADQLVQLVMNLVVNAADAVRGAAASDPHGGRDALRKGRVQVSTLTKGKNATLLIADNGPGMDEDVRRKAFDPLFTTKPAGQGTGLGLPLCTAIVAGHGGHIQLDSTPGRGTTVIVVLPLEDGV
jgi:signal transduction histidine kinase